jgi:Icc-related predicted phosphoesterase
MSKRSSGRGERVWSLGKLLKILFATDAHGSEPVFLKWLNAGKIQKADAIIMGGDITGKMIIPLVEQTDGSVKAQFMGTEFAAKSQTEIEALKKKIRTSGFYPYKTSPEEVQEFKQNSQKLDGLFSKLMVETVERWMQIAEERLKGTGIQCYVMAGNDDHLNIDEALNKSDFVVNPEGKVIRLDDNHEMISTGYTNITPWKCPRDIPDEELEKKVESMASRVKDIGNCVFNFHCPPYDTSLDLAPKLDENLKPVVSGGQVIMEHVGSPAIKKAIDKYQPLLGMHGHIHESMGTFKVGRTLCINPGSEYTEGILRCMLVVLDEKSVKNFLPISG